MRPYPDAPYTLPGVAEVLSTRPNAAGVGYVPSDVGPLPYTTDGTVCNGLRHVATAVRWHLFALAIGGAL